MITPSQQYRRVQFLIPTELFKGIDAKVDAAIGCYQRRKSVLKILRAQAIEVDRQGPPFVELSDAALHERLMEFRASFRRGGKSAENCLLPALAAIREAADRKLGLRPFPVQIMGAIALHRGWLAEMGTGEGKTLTAGLAAVLAGWTRLPCHIITVNDYLVERDCEWMRPLFTFCGVREGFVTASMSPPERRKGYDADVTYVTAKELLADFLRDRLALGQLTNPARRLLRQWLQPKSKPAEAVVLRGLHSAIVDEADSILIDEAVTPLIISARRPNPLLEGAVDMARQIAGQLEPDRDFRQEPRYREIEFTSGGRERLSALCANLPGIWRGASRRDELIRQALVAREFFQRDRQYIIADGKVVIVDEFTGRQMAQRTWRQGLHQAIEAKEGLPLSDASETIARLSFQRFFRCFHRLSGMTGTAHEAASELWRIYRLRVVSIPPNRPCMRQQWPDEFFLDEAAKYRALVENVARIHATGRPILIGTRSVAASERLAAQLAQAGLECRVLNAVRHKDEAVIVAQAGERGCITIATNMAGRGTDIKLGHGVAGLGGLHVIATERHESGRVDRQLFGRAARQGDDGSAQAFNSLEDELLGKYISPALLAGLRKAASARLPGWQTASRSAIRLAQRKAQNHAAAQRRAVVQADTWLDSSLSFAGLDVAEKTRGHSV